MLKAVILIGGAQKGKEIYIYINTIKNKYNN